MLSGEWARDGPLQSIYKLQVISTKANKANGLIRWGLGSIYGLCRSGAVSLGEISFRALKDGAGGGKGLVDLFIMKKRLKDYLLTVGLPKRFKTCTMHEQIIHICKGHNSYRKLRPSPTPTAACKYMAWMATSSLSVRR